MAATAGLNRYFSQLPLDRPLITNESGLDCRAYAISLRHIYSEPRTAWSIQSRSLLWGSSIFSMATIVAPIPTSARNQFQIEWPNVLSNLMDVWAAPHQQLQRRTSFPPLIDVAPGTGPMWQSSVQMRDVHVYRDDYGESIRTNRT